MSGLRAAVAFLTRVPLRSDDDLVGAAPWFPLVGAIIGLTVAGAYAALYPWLPSLFGAVIAIGVGVLLTGAFHEDGLADTLDAFGSGATGEEALRIMRDSRLGTYGTLGIFFSVLWRVVAVGSLSPAVAAAGLVMAHALARAGSVSMMKVTPAARRDGLAVSGISGVTSRGLVFAIVSAAAVSALATGWWSVPGLLLVGAVTLIVRRLALRRLGGVTGDVLGAGEQMSEMILLALIAGADWSGWEPWWAV